MCYKKYKKQGVYSLTEVQIISNPMLFLQMLRDGHTVHVGDMKFRGKKTFTKEIFFPTNLRQIRIDNARLCSYKGCKNKAVDNYCKEHFMFEYKIHG